MNYNDFTYHRANPYANQGYMPPTAHINRHKPQYLTQMPMGEQHLQKIGRRQYTHALKPSNIQLQNILKSPQRYPYQNRIALQKNYQRNLNTIDIEGATSGTLKSQAVRNKLRARDQLIRQQKQTSTSHFAHLKQLQSTQQEKRRQIAQQQFIRNQQIKQLNAGKLVRAEDYEQVYQNRKNMNNNNNSQSSTHEISYHRRQQNLSQSRNSTPDKYRVQSRVQPSPRYQSIQVPRSSHNPQSDSINQLIKPRQAKQPIYQSNQNQNTNINNNNNYNTNNQTNMSRSINLSNYYLENNNNNNNNKIPNLYQNQNPEPRKNQFQNSMSNSMMKLNPKQHRQLNPTVLTSQNSIYLAGRNIVQK